MKLHTVFITYNRLELTKQAIASYLDTVTLPADIVIVDNGSEDGTVEWLRHEAIDWFVMRDFVPGKQMKIKRVPNVFVSLMEENKYPGYACNRGWEFGVDPEATHLQRADNDWKFLPGWCEEVERMFEANHRLGQLGLRTDEQEQWASKNTGGNCVIRKELWDAGLRYDERPWPQIAARVGPGYTEDSLFSPKVKKMGWEWDRVERPCIESLADEDPDDEYYVQSWKARSILEQARRAYGR